MGPKEEHDSKRQKLEEDDEKSEEEVSSPSSVESRDEEDVRLFEEEFNKHGDYDFDASKVGRIVIYYPVVFEDTRFDTESELETDGELMERLSKIALKQYNDKNETKFELVRAVKANWSLGGGHIFSITLEAKDASSEPITFQARVAYLPKAIMVFNIDPKPNP